LTRSSVVEWTEDPRVGASIPPVAIICKDRHARRQAEVVAGTAQRQWRRSRIRIGNVLCGCAAFDLERSRRPRCRSRRQPARWRV